VTRPTIGPIGTMSTTKRGVLLAIRLVPGSGVSRATLPPGRTVRQEET
jgi:hypothetical protein